MDSNRGIEGILEPADEVFHQAYGSSRDRISRESPILVQLAREVALHHRSERRAYPYSQAFFDSAKLAAHVAVTLFVSTDAPSFTSEARARVVDLRQKMIQSLAAGKDTPHSFSGSSLEALLDLCLRFSDAALRGEIEGRTAFAQEAGPRISRLTEEATREQLSGLHVAVEAALTELSVEERQQLQVVVVGAHQARSSSFGMQYFRRRLQEPPGYDDRVTYGENITSDEEALALVGTRQLDRAIARAFFGDEKRLQRDVLGDAATKCLDELSFPPIG